MVSLTDFRNLGKYFMTSLTYLVSAHIQPFCNLLLYFFFRESIIVVLE